MNHRCIFLVLIFSLYHSYNSYNLLLEPSLRRLNQMIALDLMTNDTVTIELTCDDKKYFELDFVNRNNQYKYIVSLPKPTSTPCNFIINKSQIALGQTYAILHQFVDAKGIKWFGLFYNMLIVEHALSLGENTHQGTVQSDIPIVFKNEITTNQVKTINIIYPSGEQITLGDDTFKVKKNILTIFGTSFEFTQVGVYMIEITDLANESGNHLLYDINIVPKEHNDLLFNENK